ncbi:MAG: hypothetical protein LBQ95_07320 [Lachnospiraceae bacterium]|jgi:hypothetical protein|nr:hypothetical protein [Lachnospiraceae bacterium]
MSNANNPMTEIGNVFKPLILILIPVCLVTVLLIIVSLIIKTRLQGRRMEVELNAHYVRCQSCLFLGDVILKELRSVERAEAGFISNIMGEVTSGRYKNISDSRMPMFLRENYPDLQNLGVSYDNLASHIVTRRLEFRQYQEELSRKVEEFEKWRVATLLGIVLAKDFPDDKLEAVINGNTVARGAAALQKMKQLISDRGTNKAFYTGIYEGGVA